MSDKGPKRTNWQERSESKNKEQPNPETGEDTAEGGQIHSGSGEGNTAED